MSFFSPEQRRFAQAVSELAYCNPFLPERIAAERKALGAAFIEEHSDWNVRPDLAQRQPNIKAILERGEALVRELEKHPPPGPARNGQEQADRELYGDLAFLLLYHRYYDSLHNTLLDFDAGKRPGRIAFFARFAQDAQQLFRLRGTSPLPAPELAHFFAWGFQVRRAFHYIFTCIIGSSQPTARLRAAVWQSIFTHDLRRYQQVLYQRMGDITTLITGPSGTGKELVARAIALARYIPFDPHSQAFAAHDAQGLFHAINLAALSPTVIESELFGHRRGAFTGAVVDRAGYFEVCPDLGSVFLDEVGELDASIQVKLLRLLQSRTFQRLGDTKTLTFAGKVLAATNCDLAHQMRLGHFRDDIYYRLCSDIIATPSLRERIADNPEELPGLLRYLAGRLLGAEGDPLAAEVHQWILSNLGLDYPWPGNVRELEQCLRNILIRKDYRPARSAAGDAQSDPATALAAAIAQGSISVSDLISRYCTLIYARTGSYEQTARLLGLDRRTVKAKVDPALLPLIAQQPTPAR